MAKKLIKKANLEVTIMSLFAREAECQSINGVAVLDTPEGSSNWKVAIGRDGGAEPPAAAWQIVRSLQTKYDCDFS